MKHEKRTELKIEGMHCVSCERTINNALKKVPGTKEVAVSFVSGNAIVEGETDPEKLIQAVRSAGYNAFLMKEDSAQREEKSYRRQKWLVILSALLTLPLILHMFFEWFGYPHTVPLWLQCVLATAVQFGFGWRYYVGSYYALKTFTGNMDLLICLGTSAAYFYSAVIFFAQLPLHTYFETSAAIITLILFGQLLELRTKSRASSALRELLKLQPKIARVKRENVWQDLALEQIQAGDVYQMRPGEQIPLDGEVLEGSSYVDEAMLTGESFPVHKKAGDPIFGGTLNGNGMLIARATALGAQSALAQIIRRVQEAQSSKAPIQKLADTIASIFVPLVVFISLLTFFLWWGLTGNLSQALICAVAVLVIACPCALGMATPTVVMVASGRGARAGILMKNAEAIQLAGKLQIVALDKTGTLTEGKPQLSDRIPDNEALLRIAASLEEFSEHPIAQVIAAAYQKPKMEVTNFEAVPGKGVKGVMEGELYFIGSVRWMAELGITTDSDILSSLEKEGKTVVCVGKESNTLGYLSVADRLRAEAKEGVARLKALDIEVVMLTGDHYKTAEAIARQLGIETFFAEILPQDKAERVESLKKRGKLVAMVGDGINDAPALAAADVGFAMRTGTDISKEAADITLMHNDLRSCSDAIELSRVTFRKIKQNLFFAFCYNVIGIPLAAFGLLNPIVAGGAMALSSVCVVFNSLLLNRWAPKGR